MEKSYNPKITEGKIYSLWEKSGFFNPDKLKGKGFAIVVPPPNITGMLHMGHALNLTCQDILIRKKRMQGFKTLWQVGTDHAGIATQNVVEKQLKKEGKTRFDLGKEELIKRIWQWKEKYGNIILNQFKKLGCSCDWSRARFTMDKDYKLAVKEAFLHYQKKGWIYQGERVVNWCKRCQTSLSDLEIEYKEEKGHLWYIKYKLKDKGHITIATTRPETLLGDTAIAVNPRDKRYKDLINKKAILPLVNKEISIIKDRLVDPKFGTGAVKVTPAHDLKDYEMGQKHKLETIQVIDEKGIITNKAPKKYQGLTTKEAREIIVKDLEKLNLIEKIEDYQVSIPKCYRCKSKIEYIPSKQWFLKMDKLAKLAEKPVKENEIVFYPKRWKRVYLDWLKNIRDWCISRQIWWGHEIPIKGSKDVLDTWFSSALWPFATLGWPKKTKEQKLYFPTQVLSTAPDIIHLWVTRMIFSSMELKRKIPFEKIYIHPTVLTKEGKRMSKSLGTGVNPMELIEKYGADSTRFGIIFQVTERQDIKFTEDNIVMGKKFCNKIWNASRFALMQIGKNKFKIKELNVKNKSKEDKKILSRLEKTVNGVNKDLDSFLFGKAAHRLYEFFWHDFCDQYIEYSKDKIQNSKTKEEKERTKKVLLYTLLNSLKTLHPFLPHITEEIYQKLPLKDKKELLLIESWPK